MFDTRSRGGAPTYCGCQQPPRPAWLSETRPDGRPVWGPIAGIPKAKYRMVETADEWVFYSDADESFS